MIVMDIESSGLDSGKCGIWQIGAMEFENPKNTFLREARIDDEDEVVEEALIVTGKTEDELRAKRKQSQKELIENFLNWCKTCKEKVFAGQNIGWDLSFIQNKCLRYEIHDEFREIIGYKSVNLHTLAQIKYKEKMGEFRLKKDIRKSDMNLSNVMEFCGMEKDKRMVMEKGNVVKEGKLHNALEDVKLTAECIRRLLR